MCLKWDFSGIEGNYATICKQLQIRIISENIFSLILIVYRHRKLGYLYITQDEADNFRLVSTSFNEIPLGENEITPHRFVYTLEYNCFTVNLEFDVFYPSCTVFDPATGEQKTHWMPMLPLDKNCFTVSEPELRYMGENTDENGPMSEYYYRQEYLFQVNRDVEPTEYNYQLLSRHMYVAHY